MKFKLEGNHFTYNKPRNGTASEREIFHFNIGFILAVTC